MHSASISLLLLPATVGAAFSAVPPPNLFSVTQRTLSELSDKAASIRCPFWSRRAGDTVDSMIVVFEFVAARHKSFFDRPWLPGSEASIFEPLQLSAPPMGSKTPGLPLDEVMAVVRKDFERGQYYVSGRLSQAIYDDACFFDGPDPDMPVRSLRRYSDALRGLFDPSLSTIELIDMEPREDGRSFVTHWRLSGALKLPWRPQIKPYAGATLYELGDDGLIVSHTESWSISAIDAFASTVFPQFGAPPAPEAGEHVRVEPPAPRVLVESS